MSSGCISVSRHFVLFNSRVSSLIYHSPIINQSLLMKADLQPTLNPLSQIFLQLPSKQISLPPTQTSLAKLPQGAKTIGNYLLGKNIGQGTFGKVHLALHLPTSEKVAVKIIDKAKMRPKDVLRVRTEIDLLKRVRHRHIVTLYEIIETEKSLLLVTEFLPNGELFRHIIKEKRIAEDEACTYFQQIIEAVEYLHRNKIAHRDLKPENILIDYDRQLKLIDFGLSASYHHNPTLSTFCGSPCYAAPEMVEAKSSYFPQQVDLWSCGVILFAMLCGHLPFCDADTHTLFKKIIACNYKIPSYVSPEAQDLIQRLLVLAPEKRISIEEIRTHRWFNRVAAPTAFGIDLQEQLPADSSILEKMRSMGVEEERLRKEVQMNQKSKDTATYHILMKKLVRNGELVPTYIGNDNFNSKLIIRPEDKTPFQDDTESYNGPNSSHIFVKTPQPPEVPIFSANEGPLAGAPIDWDWIYENPIEDQVKDIDQGELMLLAGGILDLFLPRSTHKLQNTLFSQVLTPINTHPMRQLAFERRESEFYSHNKDAAKKLFIINAAQSPKKKFFKNSVLNRSQMKSTARRIRLNPQLKFSCQKRQRTQVGKEEIKTPLSVKTEQRLPSEMESSLQSIKLSKCRKWDGLLPSLPQKMEQQRKATHLSKRYKLFKKYIP